MIDSHTEFKLKRLVKNLKNQTGRHTELVSVYVPSGYDLNNVLTQLSEEQGTATNIKSKSTRKNVVDALEKCIQHLKLYKQTPPNGLALFCGNVSDREGIQDMRIWAVEPPNPLSVKIYRCDKQFVTEPLEEQVTPKDVYGLITLDNKNATLATLKGDTYTIHKSTASGYSGKHRAGGQSAQRFERLVREQSHNFKKRVAEYAQEIFLPQISDLRGIVVGGPAATKEDFLNGGYLHHELKKKILAVKDTTYTDESGIRELIDAAQEDLSEVEAIRHKNLMQQFMKELVGEGKTAYGPQVKKAIELGAVDTLLLSAKLGEEEIDQLYEDTRNQGGEVQIMSDETEEGYQLLNTFKGKAALLRYKIE
ncbi:MAG: peptide chain release factor 1 [Candidatus Altiarchaeales archaeon]|nr:peptide chain release factor 1 [Candidatus Altiarchaeales archaeon]